MSAENEDQIAGLVIPFVVVESKGGPFEDQPFVAGWAAGELYYELSLARRMNLLPPARYMLTALAPQIDLITMHFGFTVETEPFGDGEWANYTFKKDFILGVLDV